MMDSGVQMRLTALVLAAVLMGGVILLLTLSSQRQANALGARLSEVDSESFRIAERYRETLRDVGDKFAHYRAVQEPAAWEEFLKGSHELDLWIERETPRLTTQREKDVMIQIDAAYEDYLQQARDFHSHMQDPARQGLALADATTALTQARRHLFDLGQDLAHAHYDTRNQILTQANRTLAQLRLSVLVALGLLFLCGIALAFGVYYHLVAPLRVKLVESQTLIERQEKLASLGMLAAGVAHEIRNPLTAIKAALFLQQKKFQPGTQEHADSQLVEREILRLERIVNEFLQFARPAEPDLTALPAGQPLSEVQRFFAPQLAKANIHLALEAADPLQIRVDPGQIKQVLINLVQNAADSIGRDGTITLRARSGRARLANGETDVVILEVADTGKGIPPEVEPRLFDPFFTSKDHGTGLGLSIAARIVAKHGGTLQYQTQVNRGTTFGVVLPRVTP